jgi:hypothetical protein
MVKLTPTVNGKAGNDILELIGPQLAVQIEVTGIIADQFQKTGHPIPVPVCGHVMIDTGSPITAIDFTVIKKLELEPIGFTANEIGYGAEKKKREIYTVRVVFPDINFGPLDPWDVPGIDLMPITYPKSSIQTIMIIGRDLLKNFVLTYDGPEGTFTLTD